MSEDEYDNMSLDAVKAKFLSLPKSSKNSEEYNALHAAIVKKSKEKEIESQQKHKDTITTARTSNRLSTISIIISALALIVAVFSLYKPNKDLENELQKLKTELSMIPKVVSQPSNTLNANKQKPKSQLKSTSR